MTLHTRQRQAGMTLIELMVGLVVGLIITMAVTGVMNLSAQSKRRTLGSGDLTQAGTYAQLLLDRIVRSAGSGFGQARHAWGCPLQISRSSSQILPFASGTLPAPFAGVATAAAGVLRLVPILIADGQTTPDVSGQGSDALIVMSGHSGQAEVPFEFAGISTAASLPLSTRVGLAAGDLLLLADRQTASDDTKLPCLVTQVSSTYTAGGAAGAVALAGTYYAATINSKSITDLTTEATALSLGNDSNRPPSFQVIGVGSNNTLYSYDLFNLQNLTANTSMPIADSVFELHALYGVDTDDDGRINSWQAPTGTYALSALTAGTSAAANTLYTIKAVRIGLILRGQNQDSTSVAPSQVTLFSDLGTTLTYTRTLTTGERSFRYRTVDFTVPIVNTVLPFQ